MFYKFSRILFIFLIFNQNILANSKVYMQVIMDASGSMYQKVAEEHKIFTAKNLMRSFLLANSNIAELKLAFRVYGTVDGTCEDTSLLIDFENMNTASAIDIVNRITPQANAKTPLARSLELASLDLKDKEGKKIIFLVTDGEETCDGDPCEVAKKLLKEFDIRIEVIGFDTTGKDVEAQLGCIATDKPYFAKDKNELNSAINAINTMFAEKNLKVISPDPNVSVSLYSVIENSKKLVRTFLAGIDQMVPPTGRNEKYEAVVNFETKYVFDRFILRAEEKKILEVKGEGTLIPISVGNIVDFNVLNEAGFKLHANIKSNSKLKLKTGFYKLNYAYPPYVLDTNIDFLIIPNSTKTVFSNNIGAIYVKTDKKEKLAYYIMDKEAKVELGTYLTNTLGILKVGNYKIGILEKELIDLEILPNEITFLNIE